MLLSFGVKTNSGNVQVVAADGGAAHVRARGWVGVRMGRICAPACICVRVCAWVCVRAHAHARACV